jgi:hypothetical protein
MPLYSAQVVRVRVALFYDMGSQTGGPGYYSGQVAGMVYDEATNTWPYRVAVTVNDALDHVGDAEYYCIVAAIYSPFGPLQLVATVTPERWISGGSAPDGYVMVAPPGSYGYEGACRLTKNGADIVTTFPGWTSFVNTALVKQMPNYRAGWTGRVGGGVELLGNKVRKMDAGSNGIGFSFRTYSGLPAFFSADLDGLNAWLAENLPELGTGLRIGCQFSVDISFAGDGYNSALFTQQLYPLELRIVGAPTTYSYAGSLTMQVRSAGPLVGFLQPVVLATCGGGNVTVLSDGGVYSSSFQNWARSRGFVYTGFSPASVKAVVPPVTGGVMSTALTVSGYKNAIPYSTTLTIDITVTSEGRMSNITLSASATGGHTIASQPQVNYAICDVDQIIV